MSSTMTVKEVIEELQALPDDAEVYLGYEHIECNSIYMAGDDCIISDEIDEE